MNGGACEQWNCVCTYAPDYIWNNEAVFSYVNNETNVIKSINAITFGGTAKNLNSGVDKNRNSPTDGDIGTNDYYNYGYGVVKS